MSYVEKCNPREDYASSNPYSNDSNLIVIKTSDSIFFCFTRLEMKQIVDTYHTYDIDEKGNKVIKYPIIERSEEDVRALDPFTDKETISQIASEYNIKRNNPEHWFYSLRGFCYVNHTLRDCFNERVNTMKLELVPGKEKNLFTIDDSSSLKVLTRVYSVIPIDRCELYEGKERELCYDSGNEKSVFNLSEEITEVIEKKLELDPLFNQKLVEQQKARNERREQQERKQKEIKDASLDRDDLGLPKIEIDGEYKTVTWFSEEGTMKMRRYFKNDVLHRDDDQPAEIEIIDNDIRDNGDDMLISKEKIRKEKWYKNGILTRNDDLPAVIIKKIMNDDTQIIIFLAWYRNGMLHRENDKYALYSNCNRKLYKELDIKNFSYQNFKIWFKNGNIYRDNDRAPIVGFDGMLGKETIKAKEWLVKRPNNGPLLINYNDDGLIVDKSWEIQNYGGDFIRIDYYTFSEPGQPANIEYHDNRLIKYKSFKIFNDESEEKNNNLSNFQLKRIDFYESGNVSDISYIHINPDLVKSYKFYETKQLKKYLITSYPGTRLAVFRDRNDGSKFDAIGDPMQPVYMSYRKDGSLNIIKHVTQVEGNNIDQAIKFYPSGNVFMRYWSKNKQEELHSTNNLSDPALVVYYDTPNNQVMLENWFEDGLIPKKHDFIFMKSYYENGNKRCIFKTILKDGFNISFLCFDKNGVVVKNKTVPYKYEKIEPVEVITLDKGDDITEIFPNSENNFNKIEIKEGPPAYHEDISYVINIDPSILNAHDSNYWSDDGETKSGINEGDNINILNSYYLKDDIIKRLLGDDKKDEEVKEKILFDIDDQSYSPNRRKRKSKKNRKPKEEKPDIIFDDDNPFINPDEGGFYK